MKKILIAIIATLSLCGCSKVLDKPPLTSITQVNFFKTGDDATSAIIGCYNAFQPDAYYGSTMNILGETATDNVTSANSDLFDQLNIQWTTVSTVPVRIYQTAFIGINRANAVLKYVPGITKNLTATDRDQIVGQAYFIRALNYFNLVKCYGGVPLHTQPSEDFSASAMARSTTAETYALIESDLAAAANLLPATYGGSQALDRTRATLGAVNALQARVFLYEMKYSQAVKAAEAVIKNSNYGVGLTAPFASLFPEKNQKDDIFEIQYSGWANGGFTLPDLILPNPPASYSFPKYNLVSPGFISYIDTLNDLRFKRLGPIPGGISYTSILYGGPGNGNDQGWFINKWRSTNYFSSLDNYVVLRISEAYLTYAEASNEANGPTQDGLDKLNAIRSRAGLAPFTLATLSTKQLFRDAVDRERRLELAFEGERWFDLVRYAQQTLADPSALHKVTALDIIKLHRGNADLNYLLFPIPINELNANPLIVQNSGY